MFLSQKKLSVKQEEDNFYDVSLHENELGPSSPAEDSGFAVGKHCTMFDLTIFLSLYDFPINAQKILQLNGLKSNRKLHYSKDDDCSSASKNNLRGQ